MNDACLLLPNSFSLIIIPFSVFLAVFACGYLFRGLVLRRLSRWRFRILYPTFSQGSI